MSILSWLGKLLPRDDCARCGVGPFSLPDSHPFTRACVLHDHEFDLAHAGTPEKTRSQADKELFWRWALIANNTSDAKKACELMEDVCTYWPLARKYGKVFWDGEE